MTETPSDPCAESLAAVRDLRENFGAWTTEPALSRTLIAQCNLAEKMIERGQYDNARGAIAAIQAGVLAAGPQEWAAGV
jgi:hypothetical protein